MPLRSPVLVVVVAVGVLAKAAPENMTSRERAGHTYMAPRRYGSSGMYGGHVRYYDANESGGDRVSGHVYRAPTGNMHGGDMHGGDMHGGYDYTPPTPSYTPPTASQGYDYTPPRISYTPSRTSYTSPRASYPPSRNSQSLPSMYGGYDYIAPATYRGMRYGDRGGHVLTEYRSLGRLPRRRGYSYGGGYGPYEYSYGPYGYAAYGYGPYGHSMYGPYGHSMYGHYGYSPYGYGSYGGYGYGRYGGY